ncbi:hypothetical protein GJ496_005970 [Pomphorhynchus laevis]|nr:hypothetical protein GJ496_005970 [Pomphorhynchus laevis]
MDLQIGSDCKAARNRRRRAPRAYDQFVQRQLRLDENVDVYLADLKRLFGIITTVHNEDFLKCAFVNDLPASVKSQLITSSNFSDMQLCDIVVKARSINDQTGHRSRDCPTKPIRRCYNYGSRDHLANRCQSGCILPLLFKSSSVKMRVNGIDCNGLVDSGATRTLISKRIYLPTKGKCTTTLINGSKVQGGAVIKTSCLSVDMDIPFDALVGMDIINRLGGIQIFQGSVKFLRDADVVHHASASHVSSKRQMPSVSIRDDDFSAIFDRNSWSCEWVWKNGEPEKMYNSIASYSIDTDLQQDFEKESVDTTDGSNAGKQIETDADACVDKIRSWRRKGKHLSIMDLSRAYLQIHVREKLWKYQMVRFGGRQFCLTRLGFGFNVAPTIMKAVMEKVISLDHNMSAKSVKLHLSKYGLESKDPHKIDDARVLGLKVYKMHGKLYWKRDNKPLNSDVPTTKRHLFSFCCYLKRLCGDIGWDDPIPENVMKLIENLTVKFREHDPVQGKWRIEETSNSVSIWCDASSVAVGVVVELNGNVIEDASWLRKMDDDTHINLAELEAVIKGVNIAISNKFSKIKILTDSSSVRAWVACAIMRDNPIPARGLGQALVRRQVSLLRQILEDGHNALRQPTLSELNRLWTESLLRSEAIVERIERIHSKRHRGYNALTFRSQMFTKVCKKFGVDIWYICEYRPQGNGIVERLHRHVMRTLPSRSNLFIRIRLPVFVKQHKSNTVVHDFSPGDAVYVWSPGSRWFTEWPMQVVTGAGNGLSVEVAGIPRHIADLRKATYCKNHSSMSISNNYNESQSLANADDGIRSDTKSEIIPRVQRKRNTPLYPKD